MADHAEESTFLAVDLDVFAPFDLSPLVQALGDEVVDLYTGPVEAHFESHLSIASSIPKDADAAIRSFVKLVSALPPAARKLWDEASRRELNIGIQGGTTPHALELRLDATTIASVGRIGAGIGITVYAAELALPPPSRPTATRV